VIGVGGAIEDQYPRTARDVLRRLDARVEVTVRGKKVPLRAWRVDRYLTSTLYLLEPDRVTGWKIGDPDPDDDAFDERDAARVDRRDRELLHHVLEREVLPAYAERPRWLDIMRASIAMSQWCFSSDRQVEDYVVRMYAAAG
jgi:hypothetical protein